MSRTGKSSPVQPEMKAFFRLDFETWPDLKGQAWQDLTSLAQNPLRPVLMYSKSQLREAAKTWRSYLYAAVDPNGQRPIAVTHGPTDMGSTDTKAANFGSGDGGPISPQLRCLYSVKAQPELEVLRVLSEVVDGFDVSSRQELELIHREFPKQFVSYSGPGKTIGDLEFAAHAADRIQLDSVEEAEIAQGVWDKLDSNSIRAELSVRLSLAADSKLGLSHSEFTSLWRRSHFFPKNIRGAHWYLGRESFSGLAFEEAWLRARPNLELINTSSANRSGLELTIGLGLPSLSKTWPQLQLPRDLSVSTWNFEAGRCLVQDAAVYWAPIVAVKNRSERVVIVEGGTQHLGGLLSPVYGSQGLRVQAVRQGQAIRLREVESERTHIYGSLCLSHDRLGPPLELPRDLRVGDWLGFSSIGAYNLSASATDFIGRPRPLIWMLP
jgi:diaminopimelate decarboxylase